MPLMMDDSLDDLFSDEPLVEISSLPGLSSISRGLIQSVDDARVSGCSQYVRLPNENDFSPETSPERLPGPIRVALLASPTTAIV